MEQFNNGLLFVFGIYHVPTGTNTYQLPISFRTHLKSIGSRNTFNYSLAMTNALVGMPNLSIIQINSGSNQTETMSILCFGV